ncbi:MAG: adenylate/guanylate cyclase domain-containing protein [Deltaproteobacteria bacterium]|nr:adenylate/guanylate cyclase domain-containing protein [Deltaproteobacteria bacterium]
MSAWAAAVAAALVAAVAIAVAVRLRRAVATLQARNERSTRALEHLQLAFGRFAPSKVVEDIARRGLAANAEHREVTVLFADLRGFTALCEELEPEVIVGVLNGYFARMSHAIAGHNGHVSKFIGDGILAIFGALERNPWQTDDAIRAGLAMRAEMAAYNAELAERGLPPLGLCVGIHRGRVVSGVIGSDKLLEFTVIGRTVNLASRVEGLTRGFGVDLLVTDAAKEHASPSFVLREMPATPVKGIAEPVRTWFVEAGA